MPDHYGKMFQDAMNRVVRTTAGGAASAAAKRLSKRQAAKKAAKKKTAKKTVAKKVSTAVKSRSAGVTGSSATQRMKKIRQLQAQLKKTTQPGYKGKPRKELLQELRAIKNNKKRYLPSTPEARKNVGKKVEASRKKAAKKGKARRLPKFQGGGNL